MTASNRPLSPHLQIYKPQITSMLSILHRITGFALAMGGVMMTWWLWAVLQGNESFECFKTFVQHPVGKFMLLGWTFSFAYHLLNGIRHIRWDTGCGINMKSVRLTGWMAIIGAVAITIWVWL